MSKGSGIGHVLAPWPFLVFVSIAVAGGAFACPHFGFSRGCMMAFDVASIAFSIACVPLFRRGPREMRQAAIRNDANRTFMLLLATVVTGIILTAVASELIHKGRPSPAHVVLVIGTLALCWLFSTLVFTLHYAHLYYMPNHEGQDKGGLSFPDTKEPDYWDFAYFSSCLTMTFQTSDVDISTRAYRRIVMFHSLGAFVFNIGVIAFSINILGSS
jgi:uncharacterized membrane protein